MKRFRFSYTKMDSAARCPRYHYYDYEEYIRAKKAQLGAMFGSAGHVGLTALYDFKSLEACLAKAKEAWLPFEGQDIDREGKPGVRTWAKLAEILTSYKEQLFDGENWTDTGGEKEERIQLSVPDSIHTLFALCEFETDFIEYIAKIDRFGLSGTMPAIQEWKFLKPILGNEFISEPNNQIVGYLKTAKSTKAIVTVAKVQPSSEKGMVKGRKKSDEPHSIFTREPIIYSEHLLKEFEQDIFGWIESILTWKVSNYWPKNSPGACGFFGGCQFKILCTVEPEQREIIKELQFEKKEFKE